MIACLYYVKSHLKKFTHGIATDKAPILAKEGSWTNMSCVAAWGAVSLKSMNSKVPFGDRISINPPLKAIKNFVPLLSIL